MKILAALLIVAGLAGCTNESEALRVLEMDGIEKIQFTGYDWFGCSKDDFFHTGFTGIRDGKYVEGTVCSGLLFKNSTIRY